MRNQLCYILLVVTNVVMGQARYETRIFQPAVKTLRVQTVDTWQRKNDGERMNPTRPFLVLNTENESGELLIDGSDPTNTLEISFDELSHDTHQYTYTIIHLNANHQQSELTSGEFLRGFTTMDITDYEHSLNTSQLYTHYRFTFPSADMTITRSGNYAIQIYEDGNPDLRVADVCFSVVEPMVGIKGHVRANTDIEFNGRYQQLDIDVETAALDIKDPSEICVLVRQNGRIDNEVSGIRPTFVEPKRLRYINQQALIFEGGNEYHHFDTYSTFFAGAGVDRIVHDHADYHAILNQGELLTGKSYMHDFDVNGQQLVNAERTDYDDTEAEYMWIHWALPTPEPWFDGVLYVGGDLFQNRMSGDNRMEYDVENHCYWLSSLVKQGGADYQYWFVRKGEKSATLLRTEGSHWETENDYTVYIFWREFGARADRLVGISSIR